MLYRGTLAMLGILTLAIAGCGSGNFEKAQQANNQIIASMEELVSALEGVNSPDDANAAAARIDQVTNRLRQLFTEMKDVKVTQSEMDRLKKEMNEKTATLQPRLMAAALKASANSGDNSAVIGQALGRFEEMGRSLGVGL